MKVELTHCTTKDNRGERKKKGEKEAKGEWEAEDLHRPNKTRSEEHDYTDVALALLNNLKPLISAPDALQIEN